jgi:hypothetical protein
VFPIDNTGSFKTAILISRDRVLSELDIPQDARITKLDIESLALRVAVKSGNQASKINVTAKIIDVGQQTETIYEDYPVALTGLVGVDAPFVGLNDLIEIARQA